jgi:hypothetical protein
VNWIANNWRPRGGPEAAPLNINVRPLEVVWRTRKHECEEELKKILGVQELDTTAPEYFERYRTAAKAVLEGFSAAERVKFEAEVASMKEKGHDKETQRK